MEFGIPRKRLNKQKTFYIFLNATNRRYRVTDKKDYTVFEIDEPSFLSDATTIKLFYEALMSI